MNNHRSDIIRFIIMNILPIGNRLVHDVFIDIRDVFRLINRLLEYVE